jgi:hypothetical protein
MRGHVAHMEEITIHTIVWLENVTESTQKT